MLGTSPETSPPFFTVAVPTTTGQMMPMDGFFQYYPVHSIPLPVTLEPVCYIEHTSKMIYPVSHPEMPHDECADMEISHGGGMDEDIDVETVEETVPAADLLKMRLESEKVASCSSTENGNLTNLEPIRPSSGHLPSYSHSSEASSSKPSSEISLFELSKYRETSSGSEDDDLRRYTPQNRLRQIEEHGQYDSSRDKDRKFKCQYCHKRFVRKEEKLRHERSHTNDRKYQCRICNLRFLRADHRKGHEETHSDVKKFKCEPCNKSFRRKDEFNRHCQRKICKANKVKKEKS